MIDGDLVFNPKDDRTLVYDSDGDLLFTLPGDQRATRLPAAVEAIRTQAWTRGVEAGRNQLAAEMRRLLGVRT